MKHFIVLCGLMAPVQLYSMSKQDLSELFARINQQHQQLAQMATTLYSIETSLETLQNQSCCNEIPECDSATALAKALKALKIDEQLQRPTEQRQPNRMSVDESNSPNKNVDTLRDELRIAVLSSNQYQNTMDWLRGAWRICKKGNNINGQLTLCAYNHLRSALDRNNAIMFTVGARQCYPLSLGVPAATLHAAIAHCLLNDDDQFRNHVMNEQEQMTSPYPREHTNILKEYLQGISVAYYRASQEPGYLPPLLEPFVLYHRTVLFELQ